MGFQSCCINIEWTPEWGMMLVICVTSDFGGHYGAMQKISSVEELRCCGRHHCRHLCQCPASMNLPFDYSPDWALNL